jgi:hypothetical protein
LVFKWRGRYRDAQAKENGQAAMPMPILPHTDLLLVDLIDAGAGRSRVDLCDAVPASCQVEIEAGKLRVRMLGLSMVDRADQFLRDCLQ